MTASDERELLRETVSALVAKHAPPAAVREAMESERGYDEALWQLLCEQVGAAALLVPEELGGAGGTLADAAAVIAELGKGLVPTPLLGTTLAELALLAADEPDAEALGRLAQGTAIGAVVFDPDYVVNGDRADIVVEATGDQLIRWTEFVAEPVTTMDPTRRLARVRPQRTVPMGVDPGIADTAAILVAVEQVGAAARCLELTVNYTKQRVQFGRPIGSFQALKHRMADLYVAVQAAQALVDDAVAARRRHRRPWPGLPRARRSAGWPPRVSSCTAGLRSPGNTTCTCTSNVRTPLPSCSARRANTCADSSRKC
ncbi:acyl-CoA dehydrogenase, C-terminal domain protein [Mycobacterium xenopi 3993]|nr:acyl-CoA dehydrogenase, C-terminal domain protein [Mycobacterium xenopi 3993]